MRKSVFLFDGAIGVGKSSLGLNVAEQMNFTFIDGDDHSQDGHWLRSILQTSRRISNAAKEALQSNSGVIISYPIRCTNWVYYKSTFERMGADFFSIGLIADMEAIANRDRVLTTQELTRSEEMSSQGYGYHQFHSCIVRTDQFDFQTTSQKLTNKLIDLMND